MGIKKELKCIGTDFLSGVRLGFTPADKNKWQRPLVSKFKTTGSSKRKVGKTSITYKGRKYKRYKAGYGPTDRKGQRDFKDPNWIFCECGAEFGKYHHLGCDGEDCPICKSQLLSCGHLDLFK